jgi:hypothetical protein
MTPTTPVRCLCLAATTVTARTCALRHIAVWNANGHEVIRYPVCATCPRGSECLKALAVSGWTPPERAATNLLRPPAEMRAQRAARHRWFRERIANESWVEIA